MRHISVISKRQPAAAQTNFQALLDGMLAIITILVGGFGSVLGSFELTQRRAPFKSGGPFGGGDDVGNGDFGGNGDLGGLF